MALSQAPTVTVEVNIQDRVFSHPTHGERDRGNCPIDEESWGEWFRSWLEALASDIPPAEAYELTLLLTDDAEIHGLNAQYRCKDRPTDVLAFAALEVDFPVGAELESEPLYLGDLVISVDTANRQAQQQGHSLKTELVWLAAHGFLHLLGWDHPDESSLEQMLRQQERLLNLVGLNLQQQ
jgi:probable rRNA maturation factor